MQNLVIEVVVVAARLTDRQKKKIIAEYLEVGSYNAVAKANGVSPNTVKNVVLGDADFAQSCKRKKDENTKDMIAFMESRKDVAQSVIDKYLRALADPDKLEGASLAQIATALGIVIDKFTKNTAGANDSVNKLDGLLDEFRKAVKPKAD